MDSTYVTKNNKYDQNEVWEVSKQKKRPNDRFFVANKIKYQ